MKIIVCPFCGHCFCRNEFSTTFVPDGTVFESAVSYIECPCGAVYVPQRLRVNQCRKEEDGN